MFADGELFRIPNRLACLVRGVLGKFKHMCSTFLWVDMYHALYETFKVLLPILVPVLIAVLAYVNYLKQKEHELVRMRYLDGGLDLLIGGLEEVLSVFRHNWGHSLSLLKQFRDIGGCFDEEVFSQFREIDHSRMSITAVHRLRLLISNNCAWGGIQAAFCFVERANSFFRHDLAVACRTISEGETSLKVSVAEMVDEYVSQLEALEQKSHVHYQFLTNLLELATVLERTKFTFKSIAQFHNRIDVQASISAIRSYVAQEENSECDVACKKENPGVGAPFPSQKLDHGRRQTMYAENAGKEQRDYAWNYFQLHASQRMSSFNFFVVIAALLTTVIAATFKTDCTNHWLCVPLGMSLSVISYVFWKLDQRTRFLIKHAENALKKLENNWNEHAFYPHIALFSYEEERTSELKKNKQFFPSQWRLSYSECLSTVYVVFALLGIFAMIFSTLLEMS